MRIISLGIDCSIAYQLINHENTNYYRSPFDWIYSENLNDVIKLIDNKFDGFLDFNNYNIVNCDSNKFGLDDALNEIKFSNFIMKHKYYKIRLPHELYDISDLYKFKERYSKLIDHFYSLDKLGEQIIFIRLGKNKDYDKLPELEKVLSKYFNNFVIRFIDISNITTSSWKKNEINWQQLIK